MILISMISVHVRAQQPEWRGISYRAQLCPVFTSFALVRHSNTIVHPETAHIPICDDYHTGAIVSLQRHHLLDLERSGPQVRLQSCCGEYFGTIQHMKERFRTLWTVCSGKSVFASSVLTEGCTITSSPLFQFTGVVTRYLSPI